MEKARMMGTLRTPPELWRNDEQSVARRHKCYRMAAEKLEFMGKEIVSLKLKRCEDAERSQQAIKEAYQIERPTEKEKDDFKMLLYAAIQTLNCNLELCDGEDCTLKELRDAVEKIVPVWELARVF